MCQEIDRDGNFITYENGIVYDTETNLEWFAGPDEDKTWGEACSWVNSLSVDDDEWRMPTEEELKRLYKKGTGTRNMTTLLKTTGWYIWSCEIKDSLSAWYFNFNNGKDLWDFRQLSTDTRVFAVRSRRKKVE